jgi:hypothetical protein
MVNSPIGYSKNESAVAAHHESIRLIADSLMEERYWLREWDGSQRRTTSTSLIDCFECPESDSISVPNFSCAMGSKSLYIADQIKEASGIGEFYLLYTRSPRDSGAAIADQTLHLNIVPSDYYPAVGLWSLNRSGRSHPQSGENPKMG